MKKEKYKILMVLMGLEIGGAETHVVELCKQLKKEGLDIVVASNGGVYEQELTQRGIVHYQVPLHNKKPHNMILSYQKLKTIILKDNIDLVHAHARIPAFLCGFLHKKMQFPFMTTAHWVFTTAWGLKHVTNWGQKTLAVSEDIKKYLMQNYHVAEKDITVTINGIDTEKFSPEIETQSLKEEFELNDGMKIVYISRLDNDRSEVAFQLLDSAPKLTEKVEGLEIIIVGGGNVFHTANQRAQQINEKLGRRAVIMTGARTDINKIAALADVFIGVSRAALEAMAVAKPVIIAGNEGYIGIFDESKLVQAVDTNFTCRGFEKSSADRLARDILQVLTKIDDRERQKLGTIGRETVKARYSVKKMAEDNIRVYRTLLKEGSDVCTM